MATKKTASKKPTTKKAASKKVTKKAPAKKRKSSPGERAGSKMEKCVFIMEEMFPKYCKDEVKRKDIIERFVKEAGLTTAGASTYFQTLKNRFLEDES